MHQPRFSSGEHGDDRAMGALWDALYAADAELVLAGHDHDYERFAPQAPDGTLDEARGIVQVVVGTGGADLEAFKGSRPNSLVAINDAHGVLELTLDAGSWSFRFIDVAGSDTRRGRRELSLTGGDWPGSSGGARRCRDARSMMTA